ncbi:MAG: hypothetical protein [Olavius algarvensis Delta 4 endosymbiont]|nr:MAG: hypothetical protein [Olavius algarvensis Delta 4 endosymbiont]
MSARAELASMERRLSAGPLDFSELFVRVGQLKSLLDGGSTPATGRTVAVLAGLLDSDRHTQQTQAYHLFGSIAATLATIGCNRDDPNVSRQALQILVPAATGSRGERQRALAETVGTLPVNIKGPRFRPATTVKQPPRRSLKSLLSQLGADALAGSYQGRSLVVPLADSDEVAVIKIARRGEDPAGLNREAGWLDYLRASAQLFAEPFIIPRPVEMKSGYLFRPLNLPVLNGRPQDIDPATATAIAFTVHRDYFVYPNDHRPEARLSYERFRQVLQRAAVLFGELTAGGIVHTAPIPLFHNRVQRMRRDDGGLYEWDRAGRLDRWLQSSRFPNFGPTGLRDFEHLTSLGTRAGRRLYQHIGNQLLSLILVAGSYFRHKAPDRVGLDKDGIPLDVRHLFDRAQFSDLVQTVFNAYHTGFSKCAPQVDMRAEIESLVTTLIDQMGVDRHMREILRQEDQHRMTAADFEAYLSQYPLPAGGAAEFEKGQADIEIHSGPHLGDFNGPISVPELTTFLRSAASAIVAGRFLGQRFGGDVGGAHG